MTDDQIKLRLLKAARKHLWNGMERIVMSYGPQAATLCGAIGMAERDVEATIRADLLMRVYDCGLQLRRSMMRPHPNVRTYLFKEWASLPSDLQKALNNSRRPRDNYDMDTLAVQQYRVAWLNQLIEDYEQLVRKDTGGEGSLANPV